MIFGSLRRSAGMDPRGGCRKRYNLALEQVKAGLFAAAEENLLACLPATPNDPILLNRIALCQLAQGKLKNARANVERALCFAGHSPEINHTLQEIKTAERIAGPC